MQDVVINYGAVIVCGIVSMVFGFLWYGPVFGKIWVKLSGHNSETMDGAKQKGMTKLYLLSFVGSVIMASILAHFIVFAESYLQTGASAGLQVGFLSWLGFVAPVTLSTVLWDGKPWKLWFLNNAYYLIQLLIFGMILALWK